MDLYTEAIEDTILACHKCGKTSTWRKGTLPPILCPHCHEAGSEPNHVRNRSGYWWLGDAVGTQLAAGAKRGRPQLGDKPLTAAQRKARSRTSILGQLHVDLAEAARLARDWRECIDRGRPGATDSDIREGFAELERWIARAQLHTPTS